MRSRYAAFASGLTSYVIDTTHPQGPSFEIDRAAWEASIAQFSASTEFCGLAILESHHTAQEGEVVFRATLKQDALDASFTERSRFVKYEGKWAYESGSITDN